MTYIPGHEPKYAVGDRVRCLGSYGTITDVVESRAFPGTPDYTVLWDDGSVSPDGQRQPEPRWRGASLKPGTTSYSPEEAVDLMVGLGQAIEFMAIESLARR